MALNEDSLNHIAKCLIRLKKIYKWNTGQELFNESYKELKEIMKKTVVSAEGGDIEQIQELVGLATSMQNYMKTYEYNTKHENYKKTHNIILNELQKLISNLEAKQQKAMEIQSPGEVAQKFCIKDTTNLTDLTTLFKGIKETAVEKYKKDNAGAKLKDIQDFSDKFNHSTRKEGTTEVHTFTFASKEDAKAFIDEALSKGWIVHTKPGMAMPPAAAASSASTAAATAAAKAALPTRTPPTRPAPAPPTPSSFRP